VAEISIDINRNESFTAVTIRGDLAEGELTSYLSEYYSNGPTDNLLIDSSEGTWTNIPTSAFERDVNNGKKYSKRGKSALLFSNTADFGLGRMIESFTNIANYDTQVQCFRDKEEAIAWLKSPLQQK